MYLPSICFKIDPFLYFFFSFFFGVNTFFFSQVLNFDEKNQWEIFEMVATCLHLGNLEFEKLNINNMDASEITNPKCLRDACKLLKCDNDQLQEALTSRSTFARGEVIVTRLSATDAVDVRDAFVKAIYGRVFIFIVDRINMAIYKPQGDKTRKRFSIGVLDIFGFENFAVNRWGFRLARDV